MEEIQSEQIRAQQSFQEMLQLQDVLTQQEEDQRAAHHIPKEKRKGKYSNKIKIQK